MSGIQRPAHSKVGRELLVLRHCVHHMQIFTRRRLLLVSKTRGSEIIVNSHILFFRRQLSLHLDLEHKCHERFSKFHSCAGIINRSNDDSTVKSEIEPTTTSNETLTYDPSTNIIYYTSTESLEKCIHNENQNENFLYKWEPETKIIRV